MPLDNTTQHFYKELRDAIYCYSFNLSSILEKVQSVDLGVILDNENGDTLMHDLLSFEPKLSHLELALQKNSNKGVYEIKNNDGYTVFQTAILFCTLPVAELLIKYATWEVCASSLDKDFAAAFRNDLEYFKQNFSSDESLLELLKKRDDINSSVVFYMICNKTNDTLLLQWVVDRIKSVKSAQLREELRKLLSETCCKTTDKFNPQICAACKGNLDGIKLFALEQFTDSINDPNGEGSTMLLLAAMNGHEELVKWLITSATSSITERDRAGASALHLAASHGFLSLCKWLVEHGGATIDECTTNGGTVLHNCSDFLDVFKWFVEQGADIHARNNKGQTPFLLAATGKPSIFHWYINTNQANINEVCDNKRSAIINAAIYGRLDFIKVLLKKGAKLNDVDSQHDTPLMYAAHHNYLHIVKYLVERGADLTLVDVQKRDAFLLAAQAGNLDIVKFLFAQHKKSIKTRAKFGRTAILLACEGGHLSVVKFLAEVAGAPLSETDNTGSNALHIASMSNNLQLIQYLYDNGVKFKTGESGATVLHVACSRGNFEMVKWLIEETKADVTAKDADDFNCLHFAALSGNVTLFKYLLSKCPSITIKEVADGQTMLEVACINGHLELAKMLLEEKYFTLDDEDHQQILCQAALTPNTDLVKYLVENGADINAVDCDHDTPLMIAVKRARVKQVATLLSLGADTTINDYDNCSPLMHAALAGQLPIMKLLLKHNPELSGEAQLGNTLLHVAASSGNIEVVEWVLDERHGDMYARNSFGHDCFLAALTFQGFELVRYLLLKRFYMFNYYHTMFNSSIVTQSALNVRAVVHAVGSCKVAVQTLLVILTSYNNRIKCCNWLPNELVNMVINTLWQLQLATSEERATVKLFGTAAPMSLASKAINSNSAATILSELQEFETKAKSVAKEEDEEDEEEEEDDEEEDEEGCYHNDEQDNLGLRKNRDLVSKEELANWLFSAANSVEFAFAQARKRQFKTASKQLANFEANSDPSLDAHL